MENEQLMNSRSKIKDLVNELAGARKVTHENLKFIHKRYIQQKQTLLLEYSPVRKVVFIVGS